MRAPSPLLRSRHRPLHDEDPRGNSVQYVYDADDRLTSVLDRNSRTRVYLYDAANRVRNEGWTSSQGQFTSLRSFAYDQSGNLTLAMDENSLYSMSYDALERVTSALEPFGLSLSYQYDNTDNRSEERRVGKECRL